MPRKPRIAVIMDENTSVDGTRYDMTKGYFIGIQRAGGLPFGIPYFMDLVEPVIEDFDGLLCVGGRFTYPEEWYRDGDASKAKRSERLEVEQALMQGFLDRNKPILGICAGMQLLACLNGCRLISDVRDLGPHVLEHDKRGHMHSVSIKEGTVLSRILAQPEITVNTFHREAVIDLSDRVAVSASTEDGVIEAIELPSHRFAIGVQWHQELFAAQDHPGNRIFEAFVQAAGQS